MNRFALRVIVLAVAAALVVLPVIAGVGSDDASTAPDPVRITDYRADFVVTSDGTLAAKETLTTDFPSGRHGIFRFWDLADPRDPHVRLEPQKVAVELDGRAVPFDLLWEQGRRLRVAKIGDPDATVSAGSHTYTISYVIKGAISPADAGSGQDGSSSWADDSPSQSVFYWNVVPQGWQMDIDRSTIRMTLPAPAGPVQCSTGVGGGADDTCTIDGDGSDTVTVTTGPLAAHTPVTVRVGLPIEQPGRVTVPWPVALDRALGQSVAHLGLVILLTIVLGAVAYLLERRSREDAPGFPVTYGPPAGLGPVQTAYLTTEDVPDRALVATLMYQAEQGLTRLDRDGDSWTITGIGDDAAWERTDDITRFVGTSLRVTQPGLTFTASKELVANGEMLKTTRDALASRTDTWADGIGAQRAARSETITRVVVGAAAIALVGIAVFLTPPVSMYLLPLAGVAVGGAGLFVPGVGTRRTSLGRELWSASGGFERMLSTASAKGRFDFSGRTDLYTAFIPYAVAFDCADRWARKYETSTGSPPPSPVWLAGGTGSGATGGGFGGGNDFSGFESSLAGAISAYSATQSSSSGGGGGFSGGGGGGGGGGGSW